MRREGDAIAVALPAGRPALEVGAWRAPVELADQRLLLEVWERGVWPEVAHGDELVSPLGGKHVELGRRGVDGVGLVDDHERARPEVIEQRRLDGERPVAGGRGQFAAPQRGQLLGSQVVEVAAARGREVAGEVGERVAAREPLAGGADTYRVDAFDGPLRLGVEASDGLDLVAEELDAHRRRLGGREDVDEAAAPGGLPRPLDERADVVPRVDEARREVLDGDAVADGEACRTGAEVRGAGSRAGHGGCRGDDERRRAAAARAGEPCEHVEAALRDRGRRVLARKGQAGEGRERHGRVAGPRTQRLESCVAVGLTRHDEQRGHAQPAPQPRGNGRLRGVEDADRAAPARAEVGGGLREWLDTVEAAEQGGKLQGGLLAARVRARRSFRGARRSRGAPLGSPLRTRPFAHPV